MVENFFTKGMLPFGACIGGSAAEAGFGDESCKDQEEIPMAEDYYGPGMGSLGGRRRAEQIFSGMLVSKISPIDKYNVLANFANCPDNPGLENCAADDGLISAANRGAMGAPITVKQALDEGLAPNGSFAAGKGGRQLRPELLHPRLLLSQHENFARRARLIFGL